MRLFRAGKQGRVNPRFLPDMQHQSRLVELAKKKENTILKP